MKLVAVLVVGMAAGVIATLMLRVAKRPDDALERIDYAEMFALAFACGVIVGWLT